MPTSESSSGNGSWVVETTNEAKYRPAASLMIVTLDGSEGNDRDQRTGKLTNRRPNSRLYDVIAEGAFLLPAHDIAGEVGTFAADQHVFYVRVTDGQLNLRFVERTGFSQPVVNGIQVVHRPDR